MIRRFKSSELGESAYRRVWYDFKTEYAKSSRAICRRCNKNIEKGDVRLALMLQDIEGYKSANWTHLACFWKHPETKRAFRGLHELYQLNKLKPADRELIRRGYCGMLGVDPDADDGSSGDDNDSGDGGDERKSTSVNAKIAAALRRKGERVRREKPGSRFAGKAWSKAADIIALHVGDVTSAKQAAAISGIGKKISVEIGAILKRLGVQSRADDTQSSPAKQTTTGSARKQAKASNKGKKTKTPTSQKKRRRDSSSDDASGKAPKKARGATADEVLELAQEGKVGALSCSSSFLV